MSQIHVALQKITRLNILTILSLDCVMVFYFYGDARSTGTMRSTELTCREVSGFHLGRFLLALVCICRCSAREYRNHGDLKIAVLPYRHYLPFYYTATS